MLIKVLMIYSYNNYYEYVMMTCHLETYSNTF